MARRKPKIIIFHCAFIYSGGGERIALGQIEELKKRGYEVSCFAPILDKKKCYPDIIGKYDIKTFLPHLPFWAPFRYGLKMLVTCLLIPILAFRFKDADLFIGENQPGTWLAYVCAKVLKKPYISYLCHPNKMVYPRKLHREELWQAVRDFYLLSFLIDLAKPLVAWLDWVSITNAKQILTNGFYIGEEIESTYEVFWEGCPCGFSLTGEKNILVNGGDNSQGTITVNNKRIKRPFILFTGRHEVWKGLHLAIQAMAKIVQRFPQASLVIPGPFTKYTPELVSQARKLRIANKVVFPGAVDQKDLLRLYQNAAVYIFPSKEEDFGIVVLEAMGLGLPVVAWRAAGPTDTVVNGKTGYLVDPYDISQLAEKIVYLLENPQVRTKMGLAGIKRVKRYFSWKTHGDILEREIKKALK